MQLVVDGAIVSDERDLLALLAVGFLLLSLAQVGVGLLRGWVVMVLSNQLRLQLLSNLFRHLVRLPMIWFERRHLGDVVSRFDSMGTIQSTPTGSFLTALIDGLMVVVTLALMVFYSAGLSTVVVLAAVAYALVRLPRFGIVLDSPLVDDVGARACPDPSTESPFRRRARRPARVGLGPPLQSSGPRGSGSRDDCQS